MKRFTDTCVLHAAERFLNEASVISKAAWRSNHTYRCDAGRLAVASNNLSI